MTFLLTSRENGESELWLCSHIFKRILATLVWILMTCLIQYYQSVTTLTHPDTSRMY